MHRIDLRPILRQLAGTDVVTIQTAFSGQTLQSVLRHQKGGTNTQAHLLQTKSDYDEAGRLLKI
jgi:hypothetical protein